MKLRDTFERVDDQRVCIKISNVKEFKMYCKAMHEHGKKWSSGASYSETRPIIEREIRESSGYYFYPDQGTKSPLPATADRVVALKDLEDFKEMYSPLSYMIL